MRKLSSFLLAIAFAASGVPASRAEARLIGPPLSGTDQVAQCKGADVDIELCVIPGSRAGTFLLRDSSDGTIVASIPADPASCPDQTFEVALDYPTSKPDKSVPRDRRINPTLSVRASATTCARPTPSRVLRLERSETRYGLDPQDLAEGAFVPTPESINSLTHQNPVPAAENGLSFLRPAVVVDSLSWLVGRSVTVTGRPCSKATGRAKCLATYKRLLARPSRYGTTQCGRCPVGAQPLALVYTKRDVVRSVTDLKAFLGSIDTAADAALLQNGTTVSRLSSGSWLVVRSEVDGTCDPFERADVYLRVKGDGSAEQVARLLTSRQFGMCA